VYWKSGDEAFCEQVEQIVRACGLEPRRVRLRAAIHLERRGVPRVVGARVALDARLREELLAGFVVRLGIAVGKGVCGTAVAQRRTQVVADVHTFPGHIACDGASESEVVVPVMKDGHVIGVLDLDSPKRARFDAEDAAGLEALVSAFVERTDLG
jgi:putative methionine-R-sulfoxide reductase with GAF domain